MPEDAIKLGKSGEFKACKYLRVEGYEILEKNYRCRYGEIDIIAKKSNIIFFIEVKTRKAGSLIQPEESVDRFKISHIRNCANYYIQQNNMEEYDVCFDVISIIANKTRMFLKHIRNCEI